MIRACRLTSVVALVALAAAWTATAAQPDAQAPTRLRIVALGDSDTAGNGDPAHLGWVGRYARLLRQKLGLQVAVVNLARDGKTIANLLSEVRSDAATRSAIARADIVLLGIGGADLNAGDDRWQSGACRAEACYAENLKAFGRDFDRTAAAIRRLRPPSVAVLRAITLPNALTGAEDVIPPFLRPVATTIGVYQAKSLRQAICGGMARHGGRCVDVFRAFNGPRGTDNAYAKGFLNHADCCYANANGQELIARLLFDTGLKPLR
jgi:lysophospholipase L1-like esterase